jgi:hypothetical protein
VVPTRSPHRPVPECPLSTVLNQLVVSRTNGTNLCLLLASLPTVPHCLTSIHTAMQALGITLEREPLALRSTRNRPRTAMRRGAAWSAGRLSSFLAVRRGRLALAGGPAAEPSWLQSPRPCPQEHGWASQRAAAGRSSPGGADAGRALVTGSTSSARVRCPVSGASVQCPRVPVHATAVQCPMRTSERPGVWRAAWTSGVHPFPRPLCPTGRSWRAAVGQAAARRRVGPGRRRGRSLSSG